MCKRQSVDFLCANQCMNLMSKIKQLGDYLQNRFGEELKKVLMFKTDYQLISLTILRQENSWVSG